MPDTTVNYGFRIPKSDGTDLIVPDDVRVPVTSIDSTIKSKDDALTALTARVAALENNAPVNVSGSSAFTVASGWTLSAAVITKRGKWCEAAIRVVRSGANIAAVADGNLGNPLVGTIAAGYRPYTSYSVSGATSESGYLCAYALYSDGNVTLTATVPNNPIATNDMLSFWAVYSIP